jgi:hypothetical protein
VTVARRTANFFLHIGGTIQHKAWVFLYLLRFCILVMWRALVHDMSKLSPQEFRGFVKTIHRLRASRYGSDEYKELLDIIKPSLDHHYGKNRHHPEHYSDWKHGMGLLDIVEMFFDWKAATRRHATGDMIKSITHNRRRFNMSEDLTAILIRTEVNSRGGRTRGAPRHD